MILSNFFKKIKKFYHQKILKRKYYRTGKCTKCGCCCENIYVRHNGKVILDEEEFKNIQKTILFSAKRMVFKHFRLLKYQP